MSLPDVATLLGQMTAALKTLIAQSTAQPVVMVGIHTGGAWLAKELHQQLQLQEPLGLLDISFYRDDFAGKGLNPNVLPSSLPFSVEKCHVILVDDVIMSGRTIRAAMNELFDYGRPAKVSLAALVDLARRELPIQPDIVGIQLDLAPQQRIKLSGPEPLTLTLIERTA